MRSIITSNRTLTFIVSLTMMACGAAQGTALEGEVDADGLDTAAATSIQRQGLALVVTAASEDDGHKPANTIDGKLKTRWSSAADGAFIEYDLKATAKVSRVDVAWHRGAQRKTSFEIQVSVDGKAFTKVFAGQSSGTTTTPEKYTFAATDARYVRVVGHKNSENEWTSITETQVFGTSAPADGPAPPATPPTEPPVEPPPAPTNATVPAGVLDLRLWKVTLPVDTSHAGSPDEITQPELASFALSPFFQVSPAKNGVLFRANAGGATTSHSGYPRSELREMTGSDGKTEASWSNSRGTHTMTVREAITHLPVVKPHVVAAQIHDQGDDVIMVRLEGVKLFIEHSNYEINGSKDTALDDNYVLGTPYTVTISASGGHIRVSYNGVQKADLPIAGSGWYFKAGCYTQSNTTTVKGEAASAYGEVLISDLKVTHQY